jgi:hypothetical protein
MMRQKTEHSLASNSIFVVLASIVGQQVFFVELHPIRVTGKQRLVVLDPDLMLGSPSL